MANTTELFNNLHFLTQAQYEQETISPNDVYAVKMDSITPGEIVIVAFQNGLEVQLTEAQKAAAREWFGTGVKITSQDTSIKEAELIVTEMLGVRVKTITVDGETFKILEVV